MKSKMIIEYLENYAPLTLSIITGVILFFVPSIRRQYLSGAYGVIDSVISMDSILIGYLGVLFGMLFSMGSSRSMKKLFKNNQDKLWRRYIYIPVYTGVAHLLFSLVIKMNIARGVIILVVWGALLIYLILSVMRLNLLVIETAFLAITENNEEEEKTFKNLDAKESREIMEAVQKGDE